MHILLLRIIFPHSMMISLKYFWTTAFSLVQWKHECCLASSLSLHSRNSSSSPSVMAVKEDLRNSLWQLNFCTYKYLSTRSSDHRFHLLGHAVMSPWKKSGILAITRSLLGFACLVIDC